MDVMQIMYYGFQESGNGLNSYCNETGCGFDAHYDFEFSFVEKQQEILSAHPNAVAIDANIVYDNPEDISNGVFQLQQNGIITILIAISVDEENQWTINAFRNAEAYVVDTAAGTAYENILHATGRQQEQVLTGDSVADNLSEVREEKVAEAEPSPETQPVVSSGEKEKPLTRKEIRRREKEQKRRDKEERKQQLALQKKKSKEKKTDASPVKVPQKSPSAISCLPRKIAVVGCCPRIGTTTAALQTAMYLKAADPKQNILYQQRNDSGFLDCIKTYVSGIKEKKSGMITYQGIDMIDDPSQLSRRQKKHYSYIITDYGSAQNADFLSVMDQDMVLNICGIFPTELSSFGEIYRNTNEHSASYYLFNLVPKENEKWVMESQQDNRVRTFFLSYAPDPFTLASQNSAMLNELSKRYEKTAREGGYLI
jgi:hypothetical protein